MFIGKRVFATPNERRTKSNTSGLTVVGPSRIPGSNDKDLTSPALLPQHVHAIYAQIELLQAISPSLYRGGESSDPK